MHSVNLFIIFFLYLIPIQCIVETHDSIHLFKIDNETNKPTDFSAVMSTVSGLIFPKM